MLDFLTGNGFSKKIINRVKNSSYYAREQVGKLSHPTV